MSYESAIGLNLYNISSCLISLSKHDFFSEHIIVGGRNMKVNIPFLISILYLKEVFMLYFSAMSNLIYMY